MEIDNKNNKTDSIMQQEIELIKDLPPEIMEELKKISKGNAGLLVVRGPIIGEKFIIKKPVLTIGRSSESDIFLDDITVSRHHAVIEKKDNDYEVRDLESLNGTYLNGTIINQSILSNGDRVQVGKYIFLYFSTM